jgi:hypothetical protein
MTPPSDSAERYNVARLAQIDTPLKPTTAAHETPQALHIAWWGSH